MAQRTRRGFTLIELLVVIAIIGLLSTLAVVAMSNARLKARDAKRVSDIKQIQSALDLYATDRNGYPKETTANLVLGSTSARCLNDVGGIEATCAATTSVYMAQIPANPTPGGVDYTYNGTGCGDATVTVCTGYNITFTLEANTGELRDDPAETANTVPNCTATAGGITCT